MKPQRIAAELNNEGYNIITGQFPALSEGEMGDIKQPLNELTDDQKKVIYRRLCQMNLDDFSDFFEEVIKSGDIDLALSFVNAIKDKVEVQTRLKLLDLENIRLGILSGGGLVRMSWLRQ